MQLIKGECIVDDHWRMIEDSATPVADLPPGDILVPLAMWQSQRAALLARADHVGVWFDAHEEPESIADDVKSLPLIGVNFPKFTDGRGLSIAVVLRTRFGFGGELRALGDVQRDVLAYMRRCGFDAFAVRSDRDIEAAVAGLNGMDEPYQGSVIDPAPLFRRRRS